MQRLSYPTENVLSDKITRNGIVLSFKDSPRKPFLARDEGRRNYRPEEWENDGENRMAKLSRRRLRKCETATATDAVD